MPLIMKLSESMYKLTESLMLVLVYETYEELPTKSSSVINKNFMNEKRMFQCYFCSLLGVLPSIY
jgi:hypothetical protein